MKKLSLLALTGAALLRAASAAPDHHLELRVAPEREYVHRGGSKDVVVQIEVEAPRTSSRRHTPMNLAVVLDRSGSMQGAKIEKARQAACAAVDQLHDDDFFSL